MNRDRTQTEQRLLNAVEQIITENGLDQVGVNRISRHSGIPKILIYRYFGGLDGLLEAYYKRNLSTRPGLDINIDELKTLPVAEIMDTLCEVTLQAYRNLRQDVQMQEFLKADLMGYDLIANPLISEREVQLRQLIDGISPTLHTSSGRPFSAIIICAMTFLTFMSQQKRSILDIDLTSEEGWNQIETAIRGIYKGTALLLENQLANPLEKPL